MANYLQGKYNVINKDKYVGDVNNVVYRSSWEKRVMLWMDNNPNVLKWGSEEIIIPYYDPSTNGQRRYFPDFIMQYKDRAGNVKKALIEIKPEYQTKPPVAKSKVTKRFIMETMEYEKNKSKWAYARQWCIERGLEFVVLTEKHLGIKK